MPVVPSSTSHCEDEKNLEKLLEVFGSAVCLEEIASAYWEAGSNLHMASEKLCGIQRRASCTSPLPPRDQVDGASTHASGSSTSILDNSFADYDLKVSKKKTCSTSAGTVSAVIGREYAIHRSSNSGFCEPTKPLKINAKELSTSDICDKYLQPDISATDKNMHKDMEDFLYKMLGDGFQLDTSIIREVLGVCGYDVRKSMDKLLTISEDTLETSGLESAKRYAHGESSHCQPTSDHTNHVPSNFQLSHVSEKNLNSPARDEVRHDLQKEILEALFVAPRRSEEGLERIQALKEARRSRSLRQVIAEPPTETVISSGIVTSKAKVTGGETGYDGDDYEALRKAVNEYRTVMKEYYRSAADAFAEGNHTRADKLLEEGHFYKEKAQGADEKSAKILFETRDEEEEVFVDLSDCAPREAIRLLKPQLLLFSGIPLILKLTIGKAEDGDKIGARKKLVRVCAWLYLCK